MIEGCTLVFDTIGTVVPFQDEPYGLRAGISSLIRTYSEDGNAVFLTTSESSDLAQRVADSMSVGSYLRGAMSVSDGKGRGKVYQAIANLMRYTPVDASSKMLISGDSLGDAAKDMRDVVLLYDREGCRNDARIHQIIAAKLFEAGRGSFIDGFEYLLQAREGGNWKRVLNLGDSISLIFYRTRVELLGLQAVSNPVVEVVADQTWRRELVSADRPSSYWKR